MGQEFIPLRDALATLYKEKASIDRILSDSGISLLHLPLGGNLKDYWDTALREAAKDDKINKIIEIAEKEYEGNIQLKNACVAYTEAVKALNKTNKLLQTSQQDTRHRKKLPIKGTKSVIPLMGITIVLLAIAYSSFLLLINKSTLSLPTTSICNSEKDCIIVINKIIAKPTSQSKFNGNIDPTEAVVQQIAVELIDLAVEKGLTISVVQKTTIITSTMSIALNAQLFEQEKAILLINVDFSHVVKGSVSYYLNDLLTIGRSPTIELTETGSSPTSMSPYGFQIQPTFYRILNVKLDFNPITARNDTQYITQNITFTAQAAIGLIAYANGNSQLAILILSSALSLIDQAKLQLKQKDSVCTSAIDTAINHSLPATQVDWIHYYLGQSLIMQGNYENGIYHLEQVQSADAATCISIALAYQEWQRERLFPIYPGEGCKLLDRASLHFAMQEATKALCNAERIAVQRINSTEQQSTKIDEEMEGKILAHYHLGVIYEIWQEYDKALGKYEYAVLRFSRAKLSPYIALLAAGNASYKNQDFKLAEKFFIKAKEIEPQLPWAYLHLARLWKLVGKSKAQKYLQEAEQVAPSTIHVDLTRAELCTEWKDYDCASKAYQAAKVNQPESGWLLSQIGDFYTPDGRKTNKYKSCEAAEENYFPVVTELRTKDPWVHQRYAYLLASMGRFPEAVEHYRMASILLSPIQGTPLWLLEDLNRAMKLQEDPQAMYSICPVS